MSNEFFFLFFEKYNFTLEIEKMKKFSIFLDFVYNKKRNEVMLCKN